MAISFRCNQMKRHVFVFLPICVPLKYYRILRVECVIVGGHRVSGCFNQLALERGLECILVKHLLLDKKKGTIRRIERGILSLTSENQDRNRLKINFEIRSSKNSTGAVPVFGSSGG